MHYHMFDACNLQKKILVSLCMPSQNILIKFSLHLVQSHVNTIIMNWSAEIAVMLINS